MNEIENEQFYDNDPESFSWCDVGRETTLYSVANITSEPVGGYCDIIMKEEMIL